MNNSLFVQAITKFSLGVIVVALLIFLPAGTLDFFNGWLFMSILFVPMFIAGLFMLAKNPTLLQSRLNEKEQQAEQDTVVKLSGLMFIAGFIVVGLGVRFNWYVLPESISMIAAIVFLLAYIAYAEVLRENTYLSRTIEVVDNQQVIDTGLYRIVRHPMYSVTLMLFLTMPLILGSLYAFFIFCAYPFIIAKRIKYEEQLLEQELIGYIAYKQKVKHKLIPYIW